MAALLKDAKDPKQATYLSLGSPIYIDNSFLMPLELSVDSLQQLSYDQSHRSRPTHDRRLKRILMNPGKMLAKGRMIFAKYRTMQTI